MESELYHFMRLARQFSTGAEEWECPECGRRFLVLFQPSYQKIILEAGKSAEIHTGETGGLGMPVLKAPLALEDHKLKKERASLEPWVRWIDSVDFEGLWNRDL